MTSDPLLKWRSEFPILEKKAGYLINNSLGAMPRKVYDNLKAYADRWAEEGVVAWHRWLPMVQETADMVGRIIGAPAGHTMMHQNVSTLTSILISGLDFSGQRNKVVTTALNFPSVVYNWMAQKDHGARIEVVESRDGGLNIETEDVVRAIDDRTLVVALDLVLFRSSGLIDVRPMIEAAHRHGAMVVLDCYQATAAVPIDVRALNVDFLLGGSVKWLCGGPGAGYLYVEKVGVKAIREKSLRQTQLLMDLADAQGLTVNTPRAPERRGNTVCVDFQYSEDACRKLIERGFVVDHRPNGGIRISPHFYNSDEECRAIMGEIDKLRASGTLKEVTGPREH